MLAAAENSNNFPASMIWTTAATIGGVIMLLLVRQRKQSRQ
jgi:hypothetical protein